MVLRKDYSGFELMRHGGFEIAAGGAMFGGGLALGFVGKGGGGGGGGGEGGGGSALAGSFGGAGDGADRQRADADALRQPAQLTVVFNGPTTKAEVGIAIKSAIREAEARGF
jgi:hypothetical protein